VIASIGFLPTDAANTDAAPTDAAPATHKEHRMLIGTSVRENGIYACTLNSDTGELSETKPVGDAPRPSFLALHPTRPIVYAVTTEAETPSGGVRAFRFSADSEQLLPIGLQPTGDHGATHLAVTPDATSLIVVHYSGGSTTRLPLSTEGTIEPRAALVAHQGSSLHASRQSEPHAHGIAIDSSGQFACVADLGTDEVIVYRLPRNDLPDNDLPSSDLKRLSAWKAQPGAGPRHLAFHPNEKWLYSINELDSTMSVLEFNGPEGKLTELQTLSTLPDGFEGENSTAEVVVHPNGKFLYGSNRGHDSTALFAIASETGRLTLVETTPTGGQHPRFIGLDPTGQFLIVANRDSNNLVSFRVDAQTGRLDPTGYETIVPKPVCVVFPRR